MNNIKRRKAIMAAALSGMLAVTSLTGCGNNKPNYKAIIFENNRATIIEITRYNFSTGGSAILYLPSEEIIVTSTINTRIITERGSITAEDIAKSIAGDDIVINYLNSDDQLLLKKGN
ncbi:MAG: hypothetical protein IJK67_05520 [Bacilli bacterium]|nr:hypothetical protein [Bacilli bacterium]